MPTCWLHIKAQSSKRNGMGIFITYDDDKGNAFGTFDRILRHRGIFPSWLINREAEQSELDTETNEWRISFIKYYNWDTLIADEKIFTSDQKWFDQLYKLKKEFPMFDEHYENEFVKKKRHEPK